MRKDGGKRMGGIWYSKNGEIQVSSSSAPEGENWGQETFITTPTCPGREAFCSVLFYILQNLKTSVQPHGKLLQTPISCLQILPDMPLSCPARYPSTSELLDFFFLDSVLAHGLVSVTYLAPRLAIQSRNYTLTFLAFMLVQSKVWFLGFLSGTKYFAPRTAGPCPLLTWPT